jgi:hypothetical protein
MQNGASGIDNQGGTLTFGAPNYIDLNYNVDPLFVAPGSGNYHLSSASGVRNRGDQTFSPPDVADLDGDGIVAELVPLDLDLLLRVDCEIDLGPYETVQTTCPAECDDDTAPNFEVDVADLLELLSQ